MFDKSKSIFVAGHNGLVGSSILRELKLIGFTEILTANRNEVDLEDRNQVRDFFRMNRPEIVILAAAKVGGIIANNSFPGDFIFRNLAIQNNLLEAARDFEVERLIFLGSSCIYPKFGPQPLSEDSLLTGFLEPTNRPYAIAKIAGIETCWAFNRQFGTKFIAVMPTNLYGLDDNFHPTNSHVIPGMIRKFSDAVRNQSETVTVWGSGLPLREFLFSDDLARAVIHLVTLPEGTFDPLCAANRNDGLAPIVNIGSGEEVSIRELAHKISRIYNFEGEIVFDSSKPDGTPRKALDSTRMFSTGWTPKVTLDEGLSLVVDHFENTIAVK